jgi:hypothetical protein
MRSPTISPALTQAPTRPLSLMRPPMYMSPKEGQDCSRDSGDVGHQPPNAHMAGISKSVCKDQTAIGSGVLHLNHLPLMVRSTSPGFWTEPPGMFPVVAAIAVTFSLG